MSQIEMKELKDWLNDPTALKFKKILLNSRTKLLNDMSHNYMGEGEIFRKDLILNSMGRCRALEQISCYFGLKDEKSLENLIELFLGGKNE